MPTNRVKSKKKCSIRIASLHVVRTRACRTLTRQNKVSTAKVRIYGRTACTHHMRLPASIYFGCNRLHKICHPADHIIVQTISLELALVDTEITKHTVHNGLEPAVMREVVVKGDGAQGGISTLPAHRCPVNCVLAGELVRIKSRFLETYRKQFVCVKLRMPRKLRIHEYLINRHAHADTSARKVRTNTDKKHVHAPV